MAFRSFSGLKKHLESLDLDTAMLESAKNPFNGSDKPVYGVINQGKRFKSAETMAERIGFQTCEYETNEYYLLTKEGLLIRRRNEGGPVYRHEENDFSPDIIVADGDNVSGPQTI